MKPAKIISKSIILLVIFFLTTFCRRSYAQVHNTKCQSCKYYQRPPDIPGQHKVKIECACEACQSEGKKERETKQAEDKRRQEALIAENQRKAREEAERKKRAQEKNKPTKVVIAAPKGSGSVSKTEAEDKDKIRQEEENKAKLKAEEEKIKLEKEQEARKEEEARKEKEEKSRLETDALEEAEKAKRKASEEKNIREKTTTSSSKDIDVPYCTTQRWRIENSIARAESLNTTEAWQEAQMTYNDAFSKCGEMIFNYTYYKSKIEKGLKDIALTNLALGVMEGVGKGEIEGFMGENESENENGTGLMQMGINYKFTFGINQNYIRPYIGLGLVWTDLGSYELTYKNISTTIPNELPSNGSRLFLEKMMHVNFMAGLNGEIPLDKKYAPYNYFNLTWDLGGYIGYLIDGDPLEKYKFTLSSSTLSHEFLYGVRGNLGLELFFGESFGIGVFGGLNYLFVKKEMENTIVQSKDNYRVHLKYDTPNYNYMYGIKLIFRR